MREFLEQFISTQMFDNFITKRLYGSGEADVAFFDLAVDRFLKNAGLFADVDLGGRLLDASGLKSEKRSTTKPRFRSARPTSSKNEEPLLQSARIHRKLKTIVPPEPTGEGLPPSPPSLDGMMDNPILQEDEESSTYSTSSRGTLRQTAGSSGESRLTPRKAEKAPFKHVYATFPAEFNSELFGTPRPLPAAVVAEFDRQRKDAARFRRKAPRKPERTHFHRAHAVIDPLIPPSPEVATFTVFFTAFTAMVGKELVDIAKDEEFSERTILSTYVPTSVAHEDDTDAESEVAESVKSSSEDQDEKAGVAEMKTYRPSLGGMFGEDDSELRRHIRSDDSRENSKNEATPGELENQEKPGSLDNVAFKRTGSSCMNDDDGSIDVATAKTDESKPRERFRDKLSDLQVEEAKVTGRAQLGLAFEMLTMMKKRGLKADPEVYQCLIDACGRVGDTKRATDLLAKMHEDGIVADGTVYACLVSAFSADSAWKDGSAEEELPEWANSTAVEMDWNKLQKRSLLDRMIGKVVDLDEEEGDNDDVMNNFQKLRSLLSRRNRESTAISPASKKEDNGMEFYVTETVERQIALGENLLEIVFPDISVDTDNEVCPRCNFLLSDDDVVVGWTPDSNDYTTSCPNCTQRFVPHFCVQCSAHSFVGSKGASSPLMCERLSPWVLQKEIRTVMSEREGIDNLLSPKWREDEYKNSVLWWNLVLSCMRYRFPFSFLLQGSFDQNLIAPLPEDDQ
jgi:pentatricopeptide repeat protein